MILQAELVLDAIKRKKQLGKLYKSPIANLIGDYFVADYISAESHLEIDDSIEGVSLTHGLVDKHRHLSRIDISTLLSKSSKDFVASYNKIKRFPFPFSIDIFDTFIATEVMPKSLQSELIIIAPPSAIISEPIAEMTASFEMTGLFTSLSPVTEIALTISIDHLLEYFRSGRSRRRLFGVF